MFDEPETVSVGFERPEHPLQTRYRARRAKWREAVGIAQSADLHPAPMPVDLAERAP